MVVVVVVVVVVAVVVVVVVARVTEGVGEGMDSLRMHMCPMCPNREP